MLDALPLSRSDEPGHTVRCVAKGAGMTDEDELPPTTGAIIRAGHWLTQLRTYQSLKQGPWSEPLAADSGDGGMMFEWWNHDRQRKVTVYVSEDRVEYVQVWGLDMLNDMAEGPAEPIELFAPVWDWLMEPQP